jgi:hypothetical protein
MPIKLSGLSSRLGQLFMNSTTLVIKLKVHTSINTTAKGPKRCLKTDRSFIIWQKYKVPLLKRHLINVTFMNITNAYLIKF